MARIMNIEPIFSWWLNGLKLAIPAFISRIFSERENIIQIYLDDDAVTFKHINNEDNSVLEEKQFEINNIYEKENALFWLRSLSEKNIKPVLVLPDKHILKKPIQFPTVAEENLKEALGFEINRKTPFTQEQVYFDYEITGRDKSNKNFQINLIVAPKTVIDTCLEKIDQWNIKLENVSCKSCIDNKIDINLFPGKLTADSSYSSKLPLFLYLCAFIFYIAFLYYPLHTQNQYIGDLESEFDISKNNALLSKKLSTEKQNLLEQINFLDKRKKSHIRNIELINELTNILPDNTWLTRLSIKTDKVQIQGESRNPSSLVQLLENSIYFSKAEFNSPITKNPRTNKEKFFLSLTLENKL